VAPLSQPSYSLSKVTEQTQPAYAVFASVTTRATFRDLQKAIQSAMTDLTAASANNAIQFAGSPVFIYRGATPAELDKPFSLEIGFPAAPGATGNEKVQIKSLPAMKSLAVSFEGPISAIDKAYDAVIPEVQKRNLRQTGEAREVYNRWEGGDSLHNQIVIAVGVE
jgi:effector-binding domain-containing protein